MSPQNIQSTKTTKQIKESSNDLTQSHPNLGQKTFGHKNNFYNTDGLNNNNNNHEEPSRMKQKQTSSMDGGSGLEKSPKLSQNSFEGSLISYPIKDYNNFTTYERNNGNVHKTTKLPSFSQFSNEVKSLQLENPDYSSSKMSTHFQKLPGGSLPGVSQLLADKPKEKEQIPEILSTSKFLSKPLTNKNTCEFPYPLNVNYMTLISLLNEVTPKNFGEVLVQTLRMCGNEIPIDIFFNLLYNNQDPEKIEAIPIDGLRIDNSPSTETTRYGLKLCHSILNLFEGKKDLVGLRDSGLLLNYNLSYIPGYEVFRTFLAIKIVFDSFTLVANIPLKQYYLLRTAVYKCYYIIYQKLLRKYPSKTTSSLDQEKALLGPPNFGKIFRLVFPNVIAKRLGSRKDSKYHYIGLTWNRKIINEDIIQLIEHSLPELEYRFERLNPKVSEKRLKHYKNISRISNTERKRDMKNSLFHKPLLSFIDVSKPSTGFQWTTPFWEGFAGNKPQPSEVSKTIILNLAVKLTENHADVSLLIQNFDPIEILADSGTTFCEKFAQILDSFAMNSTPKEPYLYLFLMILLMVFPVTLACEKTVDSGTKIQFRAFLENIINVIHSRIVNSPPDVLNNAFIFTKIIRRMILLSDMLIVLVNSALVRNIVSGISHNFNRLACSEIQVNGFRKRVYEVIVRAVTMATVAFDLHANDAQSGTLPTDIENIIISITNRIMDDTHLFNERIQRIPDTLDNNDHDGGKYGLPYHFFKLLAELLHSSFFEDPAVRKLPMRVIWYIVFCVTNEVSFGKTFDECQDQQSTNETFECWWLLSTCIQEYLGIVSEISGILEILYGNEK